MSETASQIEDRLARIGAALEESQEAAQIYALEQRQREAWADLKAAQAAAQTGEPKA